MKTRRFLIGTILVGALWAVQAEAQNPRTVTRSQQLQGEKTLDVTVRYGAGEITLHPISGDLLYHMDLEYGEDDFEPLATLEDGRLLLGVDDVQRSWRSRIDGTGEMTLGLSTEVLVALTIETGAVKADFELGGLRMSSLQLETGASKSEVAISEPNRASMDRAVFKVGAAEFKAVGLGNLNTSEIEVDAGVGSIVLDFTGEWERDVSVDVKLGLGSSEFVFPEGLGVMIEREGFLFSLDSQELIKRGNAFYSTNWEEADRRVTIQLRGAMGQAKVRWVR